MDDALPQPLSNLWPALALALGFPLVVLVLNEAAGRLRRRGSPLADTVVTLRNLVAPAAAVLLFVRGVIEWPQDSTTARLVESAFWVVLLYALLGAVDALVFGLRARGTAPATASRRLPKLFRDLARAVLVGIGATVIYSEVWGQEISAALTALGLGSIVIGLALQEPLGNIVSGLMLLLEQPVSVGDWVQVEEVRGRVIEINWRSVHIETPTRELQIVPNVELYKASFANLSRPTGVRTEVVEMGFGYDDPPNRVKEVMLALLASVPGVLADPPPRVRTANYGDFSVTYKLVFSVASQAELFDVRDELMTRLWYVSRREGLTIPYPIQMEYGPEESPGPTPPTPGELLREHARFRPAVEKEGAPRPAVVDWAHGETVQSPERRFEGFALVLRGGARLLARDSRGGLAEIGRIGPGESFGSQLAAGAATTDLTIVADGDLKALVFEERAIADLLASSPSLAAEIGDALESRRQAAIAVRRRG